MNGETVEKIMDMALGYAPKVIMAILTLMVGFWIISKITGYLRRVMKLRGIDDTLGGFLASLASIAMKVMLLLSVAAQFGVNTTSFIAIIGALMVGIGMALNGSIGHFASGVMLMIFKPFRVGDLVTIGGGSTGVVESINAFNTTLATLDNKRIIIANSNVTGNTITNISGQGTVGVELTFGIDYNASIDQARQIILGVGEACPYVLKDPAQGVVVAELGDNSVNLATRPFCKSEHYWDTFFYMNEHVKKELDKAGISIPFPQVDVHMIQN
jgi:small conductance mechanosensitive channel